MKNVKLHIPKLTNSYPIYIIGQFSMATIETESNPKLPKEPKPLLKSFFESEEFHSLEPISRDYYRGDLKDWLRFLRSKDKPVNLGNIVELTVGYFDHLKETERKPSTIARRGSSIRKFAGWAVLNGLLTPDFFEAIPQVKVERGKQHHRHEDLISQQTVDALRESTLDNVRNAAIVELLIAGVRPSQIVTLKRDHILTDKNGGVYVRVENKHSMEEEILTLSDYGANVLKNYDLQRSEEAKEYLFEGSRKPYYDHLTRPGFYIAIRSTLKRSGIETPNHLRTGTKHLRNSTIK